MPSLTLIVPPLRIPKVNSEVVVVSGTVPVPMAGDAEVGDAEELESEEDEEAAGLLDEDDAVALLDEDNAVALPVVP